MEGKAAATAPLGGAVTLATSSPFSYWKMERITPIRMV
jgi:hypothetical protein